MINAGVSVTNLSSSGSTPDLGAFEHSGSSPVNQPPVANSGSDQLLFSRPTEQHLVGAPLVQMGLSLAINGQNIGASQIHHRHAHISQDKRE
jgi:hypothetical protein